MDEKNKFVVYGNDEGYRVFERSLDQYITKDQFNAIKTQEFQRYVKTGIFPHDPIQDLEQQRVDKLKEMRSHNEEMERLQRKLVGVNRDRFTYTEDKLQRSNPQPINQSSSLGKGLFEQIRQSSAVPYEKLTKQKLEEVFKTVFTPSGHTVKYIDSELNEVQIGCPHADVNYTTINKIFNE